MTIAIRHIAGDVVELVFSPWEEDLRVGEILSIVDRRQARGLIVQILEIHTESIPFLSAETALPRRDSHSRPFAARKRSPKTSPPSAPAPFDHHLAIAKIRKLTTPDWQAWDGWIPTRDALVSRIPDREILHHCIPQPGNPLLLGRTLAGEALAIEARALTGVNIITGTHPVEAGRLAALILRGLVTQGRPGVICQINPAPYLSPGLSHLVHEARSMPPNIVWLRAGSDFKLDVRHCSPAALLTLLTQFGLPKLPALYFVNHVAQRLATTVSAEGESQTAPFLGIEELLQLAAELEASGNKMLLGAILSCLRLIKQEGVLARTPAEATSFQGHYALIRPGGGIIVDLSVLGNAARGGATRAIVDMLVEQHVAEQRNGSARAPYLMLEEPHLYLRPEDLQEILMRARSLEMISLIVTARPSGIDLTLLQRADNLFFLRHECPDDLRTLTNSGLLDQATGTALSCRLGTQRGLLVGKASGQFPMLFTIEALDDQPDVSLEFAIGSESSVPSSSSESARLSRSQSISAGSRAEATLPLFPEDLPSGTTASPPLPHGEQAHTPPVPSAEVSLAQITAAWDHVIKRVGRRRRILETILSTARPMHLDRQTLLLGFPPQSRFQQELMASPEYRSLLEEELTRLFGVAFEVTATFHPMPETPRR